MKRMIGCSLAVLAGIVVAACSAAEPERTSQAEELMWSRPYEYSGAYVDLQTPPAMEPGDATAPGPGSGK